jgi:plasmid segregation protein ParM
MKIIGLDVGRHRVKAYSNNARISFPAFSGQYRELRLERQLTHEDKIVEYNGHVYYVGAIAQDESDDGAQSFLRSKATFDTQLLGLTAIHHLVESGEDIHLTIGHPVANHNKSENQRLRELFEGKHQLRVNGVWKHFNISNVTVTSECACATYLLPEKHPIAHGIDGGGATTNFVTWKRGMWIDRLSGTLPFGLDNVNFTMERYARLVAIEITKQIHEFRGPIYTMGGAALPLSHALKLYITHVPIIPLEEGMFANAKAYYTVGTMVREKLQAQ